MPRRSHTTHHAILPERPLPDCILDLTTRARDALPPTPPTADAHRRFIALAVETWNAHVHASKLWGATRTKPLTELRQRVKSNEAPAGMAAAFKSMSARWKEHHWTDPRLVGTWSLDPTHATLTCEVTLPDGVEALVPPPLEKRVRVGGVFLDEASIHISANSVLRFPIEAHRGTRADDGEVTIRTKTATAVALFANGRLSPIGDTTLDIMVAGKQLGPMLLVDVRCVDLSGSQGSVELVLRPAPSESA